MRSWDVVLYGATGFTGRLVAERLTRISGLRWAIAGRDQDRLRDVKAGLVGADRSAGHVGIIVADTTNPASLAAMAASTKVVATTVGPYVRHGLPLVSACVAAGTHYADITGEPQFVSSSRRQFDAAAREAGVRIVHACGFDAIPADLGVQFTVAQLPDGPRTVRGYLKTKGSPSGGTWASLIEALAGGKADATPRPEGDSRPLRAPRPRWHAAPAEVGGFGLPLPVIDPTIVLKSSRLLPEQYGEDFAYEHYLRVRNRRTAAKLGAGVAGLAALSRVPMAKRWLQGRIPSGTGPDEEIRARSFFALTLVGRGGGSRVVTRVSGGDPGYTETSRMLATCAHLLASSADLPPHLGVLTPASAFGETLRAALHEQGIRFETLSPSEASP